MRKRDIRAAQTCIEGAADEYLEDAVCLLSHIELDPNADPDNDTPQRTARMAVEKIREAQQALAEARAQLQAPGGALREVSNG